MESNITALEAAKEKYGYPLLDDLVYGWKYLPITGLAYWLAGSETALSGTPMQEIADELLFLRQVVNRMDWTEVE